MNYINLKIILALTLIVNPILPLVAASPATTTPSSASGKPSLGQQISSWIKNNKGYDILILFVTAVVICAVAGYGSFVNVLPQLSANYSDINASEVFGNSASALTADDLSYLQNNLSSTDIDSLSASFNMIGNNANESTLSATGLANAQSLLNGKPFLTDGLQSVVFQGVDNSLGLTTSTGKIKTIISAQPSITNNNQFMTQTQELVTNIKTAITTPDANGQFVNIDDLINYISQTPQHSFDDLSVMTTLLADGKLTVAGWDDVGSIMQTALINRSTESLGLASTSIDSYQDLYETTIENPATGAAVQDKIAYVNQLLMETQQTLTEASVSNVTYDTILQASRNLVTSSVDILQAIQSLNPSNYQSALAGSITPPEAPITPPANNSILEEFNQLQTTNTSNSELLKNYAALSPDQRTNLIASINNQLEIARNLYDEQASEERQRALIQAEDNAKELASLTPE